MNLKISPDRKKKTARLRPRSGAVSGAVLLALFTIIVIVVAGAAALSYNFGNSNERQLQNQVNDLESKLSNLPAVNQTPIIRNIVVEWSNAQNSGQDRFFSPTITVNQGDTVAITFLSNDTDAHTFTLESPYNFQINATLPGTTNYLQNQSVFTTNATNNSPGVKVYGKPGNVTATGSFVAKYSGIFEYFCVYHVQIGMFGYLTVLPNAGYSSAGAAPSSHNTTNLSKAARVSIAQGAGANTSSLGYSPSTITVIIGVNNTVVWTNDDIAPHTVTADDGSFSSGNMNHGDTFTKTFTTAGTYTYHCNYHSWMKGKIIVKSG